MKEMKTLNAEEVVNLLTESQTQPLQAIIGKTRGNSKGPVVQNRIYHKGGRKKDGVSATLNVLAAQTLKIASINGLGRLDKLEHDLEDEINYENRSPAKTKFGRFRQVGSHQLHSKVMLFVIVVLNIIDTLLVMIGMILDFHHVSLNLRSKSEFLKKFTDMFNEKYHKHEKENEILQLLINTRIIFNTSSFRENVTDFAFGCKEFLNGTAIRNNQTFSDFINMLPEQYSNPHGADVCFQSDYSNKTYDLHAEEVDETLSIVAHKLHYCSLSILSLLVIILLLKLICFGRRFFKERMLVFDALITIISFVLDIVFMNGVTFFTEEQFVIILTLLFPWRVIRILNSLIAAVLDKQRLNLKILYTQKKKISRTLTETNSKIEVMQRHIEVLQSLCSQRGIGDSEVRRALSGDTSGSSMKNGGVGGLASMMALGKLAYQAADALAPMSNGYKKPKSAGSSPALSSQASSPYNSPTKSIDNIDNNNAVLKNQNDRSESQTKEIPKMPESSPDSPVRSPVDVDNVTIHINGSGPPTEDDMHEKNNDTTVVLPDDSDSNESQLDSRL